jgi:hypothetical protein
VSVVRRYRAPLVVLAVLSLLLLIGVCQQRATGPSAQASEPRSLAGVTVAGRGSAANPKDAVGLAPQAELINVRVTGAGDMVIAGSIALGISQAVADGAQIIDVALGVPDQSAELARVVAAEKANRLLISSTRLGLLDPGLAVSSRGMKPDLAPAASASLPPSTQPPASRTPDPASPTSVSPQTAGRPKPGPGFSIWDLVGVAVIVVAVLGGVLAWVARRRSPASGARHPRDWGLEPR